MSDEQFKPPTKEDVEDWLIKHHLITREHLRMPAWAAKINKEANLILLFYHSYFDKHGADPNAFLRVQSNIDFWLRMCSTIEDPTLFERFLRGTQNIYVLLEREFARRFPVEYQKWEKEQDSDEIDS